MTDHQQAAIEAAFKELKPRFLGQPRMRCEDATARAIQAAEPYMRQKWAEELERAMFKVESVHHFGFGEGGIKCLCGFESARNRSRTEHITQAVRDLVEGGGNGEFYPCRSDIFEKTYTQKDSISL